MSTSLPELITRTKKLKLLYVEDNEDARRFTLEMLTRFFDHISVAESGMEGLKKFQTGSFDLVLSDINMPGMNGIEMICEIKKTNTHTVALLLSAHNEQHFFDMASKCGIQNYLSKPLSLSELIKTLTELLSSEPTLIEATK